MKAYARYLNIFFLSVATLGAVSCASEDPKQKFTDKQMTIGEVELNAGDLKGAYNTFSKAITANKDNYEAWRMRAEVQIRQNKLPKALKDLNMARIIMKKSADIENPKIKAQFEELLTKIKEVETAIKAPKTTEAPALAPAPVDSAH